MRSNQYIAMKRGKGNRFVPGLEETGAITPTPVARYGTPRGGGAAGLFACPKNYRYAAHPKKPPMAGSKRQSHPDVKS